MSLWEKCTITDPDAAGDAGHRVDLDGSGPDWVRVLSPKYVQNDGTDYVFVGNGIKLIQDS
jgi:hypothetical protein